MLTAPPLAPTLLVVGTLAVTVVFGTGVETGVGVGVRAVGDVVPTVDTVFEFMPGTLLGTALAFPSRKTESALKATLLVVVVVPVVVLVVVYRGGTGEVQPLGRAGKTGWLSLIDFFKESDFQPTTCLPLLSPAFFDFQFPRRVVDVFCVAPDTFKPCC